MNNRILELADQADVSQLCRVNGEWGSKLSPELQKFAELIIQECAQICKDTAEKQFNPLFSRESDGAQVCHAKVKEFSATVNPIEDNRAAGVVVTFSGRRGRGKTTLMQLFAETLKAHNINATVDWGVDGNPNRPATAAVVQRNLLSIQTQGTPVELREAPTIRAPQQSKGK